MDVCVVGGGLAGLTTALELARRGKSVALLEANASPGASGRNGGFVSNGFAWGVSDIARKVGMDAARSLYQLSRHGTEYVRREILEGDPSIKMGEGWLGAIRYDNAAEKREEVEKSIRELGQEKVFLDTGTCALVNTQRYFQSALDPTAFHMHPLRYALMIARKAETAGARLFEMSPAVGVEKDAARYKVRTAKGEVRCAEVVYCVSALDRNIYPAGRARCPACRHLCGGNRTAQPGFHPYTACLVGFAAGRKLLPADRRGAHPVGRRDHHARLGAHASGGADEARHAFGVPGSAIRRSTTPGRGSWVTRAHLVAADRHGRAGAMVGHRFRRAWDEHDRDGRHPDGTGHRGER